MWRRPTKNSGEIIPENESPIRQKTISVILAIIFSIAFLEFPLAHIGPLSLTTTEVCFFIFFIFTAISFKEIKSVIARNRIFAAGAFFMLFSMLLSSAFASQYLKLLSVKFSIRFFAVFVLFIAFSIAFSRKKNITIAFRALATAMFLISLVGIAERFYPEIFEPLFSLYKPNRYDGFDPGAKLLWATGAMIKGKEVIPRASSIFPYCNTLAYFLTLAIHLVGYQISGESKGHWKNFGILSMVVAIVAIYFTYSRGALWALGFGALAALVFWLTISWEKQRRLIIGVAFILLIITFSAALVFVASVKTEHRNGVDADEHFVTSPSSDYPLAMQAGARKIDGPSLESRIYLWKAAYKLFLERPVVGWGVDSFRYQFYRFVPGESADLYFGRALYQAHNLFLGFAAQQGVVGLFALLFLGYLIFRKFTPSAWKGSPAKGAILFGFGASFFTANLYDWIWIDLYAYTILFTGWAALVLNENNKTA